MALVRNIGISGLMVWMSAAVFAVEPQIGYLYPAGGQQGTTVRIVAGGQFLNGAETVYVSGDGVTVKSVHYMRGFQNLNGDQRRELQRMFKECRDKRIEELPAAVQAEMFPKDKPRPRKNKPAEAPQKKEPDMPSDKKKAAKDDKKADTPPVKLPTHPLLEDLDSKSLRELAHAADQLFMPRNLLQPNRQLAEMVIIELAIAADAEPGFRELRIRSRQGLTNPLVFQVGTLKEVCELEPNDTKAYEVIRELPRLLEPEPLELPVMLNGQIRPGDVDRFRFRAKKGQQLVVQTYARRLIPYLADAVPGWFQATVSLYTAAGSEIAFADDFRFDPDPVLYYQIERDGFYELEIRDSIYRGREDFVYRVAVGELPFITQMFPLGGPKDSETVAAIDGWNLPTRQLTLDMHGTAPSIARTAYRQAGQVSNIVPYAIDEGPECREREDNDTIKTAQDINLPMIVNGQIGKPGDADVFRFSGKAGEVLSAEVYARRLNSPLDGLLRVTDAAGTVVAWNDDYVEKDAHLYKDIVGTTTHHADPCLTATLPKAGTYYVQVLDSQGHGGEAFGYRLHIGPARPDFAARVTPSSVTIPAATVVPLTVHVLRKNYDGPIELSLRDAPAGFVLGGATVPAGRDRVTVTLQGPDKPLDQPVNLHVQATAAAGGHTITRDVVPAENQMQAFLYRHLVPSEQLLTLVTKGRWGMPPVELPAGGAVKIPLGGTVQVKVKAPPRAFYKELEIVAVNAPEGLEVGDLKVVSDGLVFTASADAGTLKTGYADNLVVEAFRNYTPSAKEGQPKPKPRRDSMGVLRAIPIQIVDANPDNEKAPSTPQPPKKQS